MLFRWALTNRDGEPFGWFTTREPGSEIEVVRNGQRTARLRVSVEDDLIPRIHPGRSRLLVHAYAEGDVDERAVIFSGIIGQPRVEGRTVEVPAVDQSLRLLNALTAPLPVLADADESDWDEEVSDPGELLWRIVRKANRPYLDLSGTLENMPPIGIKRGRIEGPNSFGGVEIPEIFGSGDGDAKAMKIPDGEIAWDAMTERARRDKWPDFELEPIEVDDNLNHARLNTFYPRQGSDKTDSIILVKGRNVPEENFNVEVSVAEPGLCNIYALVGRSKGQRAPVYVAKCNLSISRFGAWVKMDSAQASSTVEALGDRAKKYVANHAFPVKVVELTPAVEIGGTGVAFYRDANNNVTDRVEGYMAPPRFGPDPIGDYWIGDKILAKAKNELDYTIDRVEEGEDADIPARVEEAVLTEVDRSGNVQVSLTCLPVIDAPDVSGYESTIRTEGY